jgi:hypothetical protein
MTFQLVAQCLNQYANEYPLDNRGFDTKLNIMERAKFLVQYLGNNPIFKKMTSQIFLNVL